MKRTIKKFSALSFVLTFFLTSCSPVDSLKPFDQVQASRVLQQHYTPAPTQQMVVFKLPQKQRWKKIDLSNNGNGSPIMMIPINENKTNWTESIRTFILGYQNRPDATPVIAAQQQIDIAKSTCTGCSGGIILATPEYAIYELHLSDCNDPPHSQTQYGKAMKGRDAIYIVYYSTDSTKTDNIASNKMQQSIKSAYLITSHR